jgi:hypothetical protein
VEQLLLEVLLYPLSDEGVVVLRSHTIRLNALEVLMLHVEMMLRPLQTEVAVVLLGLSDEGMTLIHVNLRFLHSGLSYIPDKALVLLRL